MPNAGELKQWFSFQEFWRCDSVMSALKKPFLICWFCLMAGIAPAQKTTAKVSQNEAVLSAQMVAYCEILQDPQKFQHKMIRVRALYETDFEKSAITSPSCYMRSLMIWIDFDQAWESRSTWRVRHALSHQRWGIQMDVVFIGIFKADGHYGHLDMYPFKLDVYKVEAARPSGRFRPMPD